MEDWGVLGRTNLVLIQKGDSAVLAAHAKSLGRSYDSRWPLIEKTLGVPGGVVA